MSDTSMKPALSLVVNGEEELTLFSLYHIQKNINFYKLIGVDFKEFIIWLDNEKTKNSTRTN
jgi:hypothetical protein